MFRYKRGVKVDYDRQGYIYFVSRMYKELPAEDSTSAQGTSLMENWPPFQLGALRV